MSIGADSLVHLIKQLARDEVGHQTFATWGYVAAYDVATHSIKAVLPTFRATGPNGELQPIVTDWIQLATPWSGDGFGDQMSPYAAAATPQDPSLGEQVQISIISSTTGASVATAMLFNTKYPPPGGINPGERILKSQAGNFVLIGQDQVQISADAKSVVVNQDDVVINGGDTPVAVEGSTATHDHGLATLIAAINTGLSAAASGTYTPVSPSIVTAETAAAIDAGRGAQDFLAPAPGGD